ncbi:proton channel OtopLc isoform X2 [Anabrus simplex]|uniref:proton channel OtopLc isoform X2 n=1 Tax=Anabrus simplex TaxID=316456 RepID=UPI0034DD137C
MELLQHQVHTEPQTPDMNVSIPRALSKLVIEEEKEGFKFQGLLARLHAAGRFELRRHSDGLHERLRARRASLNDKETVVVGTPADSPSSPEADSTALSVHRSSAIISVTPSLRRPSAVVPITPSQSALNQQRYMMGLMQGGTGLLDSLVGDSVGDAEQTSIIKKHSRRFGDDDMTMILSALYAKLLVVLGIAFPVTEVLSEEVPIAYYQGFYLFLYLGSIFFMCFMYATLLKDRAVSSIINSHGNSTKMLDVPRKNVPVPLVRYGSFYLRLGAIAFGIGSMVYSGLEFGQYFELKKDSHCHNVLQALNPATRMVLTMLQMQFMFLNGKDMRMSNHRVISRFGLMHMIASNLCEWLYVLVEETRHEILHLYEKEAHLKNLTDDDSHEVHGTEFRKDCRRSDIMGHLVQDASPFLFPCTIEYSLICAVILYEMWKNVKKPNKNVHHSTYSENDDSNDSKSDEKSENPLQYCKENIRSHHHFSVDCANAHKGLFGGILVLVLTIISLILFFVLNKQDDYRKAAIFEVNVCELVLYVVCTVAVMICMWQMRDLRFHKNIGGAHGTGLGLDNSLLLIAQTGMYIYCMFSIIGCYFTSESSLGLVAELFSLVQTTCQTVFVLDAWRRRCRTAQQARRKPGRQIVTFLLVANMSMWTINTLEKGHAEFRPSHLKFFGLWAWTIITHVSMPLAIFYRFHSTICLFEIWKSAYKFKPQF